MNEIADIFQTISNTHMKNWKEAIALRSKHHWILFLKFLLICWFRGRFGSHIPKPIVGQANDAYMRHQAWWTDAWMNNYSSGFIRVYLLIMPNVNGGLVKPPFKLGMDEVITHPCLHLSRDHFVYAPSQWETTLQCNVVSHWLGAFTKLSLS